MTNHPGSDYSPAWSPDGNWIAFVSDRTGESHIYKIDINGENLQRLTNQGSGSFPTWSPDGQSIAFKSSWNDGHGIFVMDADGKHPRQIINPRHVREALYTPAWSPDGKQIACVVAINRAISIYIMDTDGQNARLMSSPGTWSYNPVWSPDGKWIAYDAYDAEIENAESFGKSRMWGNTFLSFLSKGASDGKSHNILGNIILPHGFPKVFSPFLRLWTPRRPSGVG